jgi:putative ABC transport system permease protein
MTIAIPLTGIVMHQWLENFAYRIEMGWWMFLISGMTALIIAIGTIGFRAIKAALANPVDSLKRE